MAEASAASWIWLAAAILPLVPVLSLLTALLERSGPIRMRHWVEEAGGRLRALFEHPVRFEVFRYLLNVSAKLAPLLLFAALAAAADGARIGHPLALSAGFVAIAVAATELASRSLLGWDPEEALRRMTWLYRMALVALMPVVLVVSPLVPRRQEASTAEEAHDEEASEEEVEAFLDVGTREGILEPEDRDLVWGVVDFGDTQVRSVMTPRVDMVCAEASVALEQLAELFATSSYSRIPLFRESIDQIVGIVHIRDLLVALRAEATPRVAEIAQAPMLVPETKLLGELLKEFQARRQQMAIVINEWGGTEGLVTVEDLVEEIVGEIADEHDESLPENRLLEDGSVLLDGRAEIELLDEFFSFRPAAGEDSYETVGGFVSGLLGRVPEAGERIEHAWLRFEIEQADERRILSMRVCRRADDGEIEA